MRRLAISLMVLLLSAVVPLAGHASNMRFLEFSPSAYFNEEDWHLLRTAARNLLDNHKDGESVSWKNDKNGHNGTLELLGSFADFGTTCRRVKVFSDAVEVSATRVVSMCKNKEGEWKILN